MDTYIPDRTELQERQVSELVAHHPLLPSIHGHHVRFDNTWDGEPAIWVYLHQPGDERGTEGEIDEMRALKSELREVVRQVAPDREVYVRFVLPPPPLP